MNEPDKTLPEHVLDFTNLVEEVKDYMARSRDIDRGTNLLAMMVKRINYQMKYNREAMLTNSMNWYKPLSYFCDTLHDLLWDASIPKDKRDELQYYLVRRGFFTDLFSKDITDFAA